MRDYQRIVQGLWVVMLLLSAACRHELEQQPRWESDILAPLLKSEMDIGNVVGDTLVTANSDSSLNLVYQNVLYSMRPADELINVPDTFLQQTLKLDSLKLSDITVTQSVSLGEMAQQMGAVGAAIIASNGSSMIIPPLSNLSSDDFDIDASEFFQTITFKEGYMDITIANGLPVDLTNVVFQLTNKSNSSLVVRDTFALIPSMGMVQETYDLAGKTVEGNLVAKIINMDSPGSGLTPVPIDTSDAVTSTVRVYDIKVQSATAVFPAQNLIDYEEDVIYNMGGPELDFMSIRSGILTVVVTSTIEDTVYVRYRIPNALNSNGDTVIINAIVPPAPPNGSITVQESLDLSDYNVDLTGKSGTQYNAFFNELTARIDSTGEQVSISLEDSIYVSYALDAIIPEYVHGYMGQDTFNVGPESSTFDLFNNIKSGSLDLEEVTIGLEVENSIGVDGRFVLNSLQSTNTATSNSISLNSPTLLGVPQTVGRATDGPLTPWSTTYVLDKTNSNVEAIIENFPDQFTYSLDLFINPNGNTLGHQDFAYFDQGLDVNMNIEIPLSFISNQLTLVDTVDFALGKSESADKIRDGIVSLIAYNGFPLDVDIQIYLYDKTWQLVDSLFSNTLVNSGKLSSATCKVSQQVRTKLNAPVSEDRIRQFRKAEKAIVVASFNNTTATCNGQHLKIYSNYILDLKLVANFTYILESGL